MGIYLPNMEMPNDCIVCPLGWNGCNHQHDFVYMGERPSDCPLIPVPPHGDLIDRDAIPYNKIMLEDDDFYYGVTKPYIDRMPTIITAEEGK